MIATSHIWRDEHFFPPITGLYLPLPLLCVVSVLPEHYKSRIISWEQKKDAPIFNRDASDFAFRMSFSILGNRT
jgi:hypothetical protein